jgi:hypothetical protein
MAVMTPVRTRTPGPVADLHVASDLQDHPRYPVRSNLDALKSAAGEHFAALPASAVQAAESLTVPSNRGIARDTVGAANPLALASRDHGVTLKHSDASVRTSVERALATDIAKLVDPAHSTVIYPGIELDENGLVTHVIRDTGGGGGGGGVTWVDAGHFFTDAAQFTDPVQGDLADCYFIAALASVAWAGPLAIQQRTLPTATKGAFADSTAEDVITLFGGSGHTDIDATELLPQLNGQWIHARADDSTELWPGVYEKAFAMWKTGSSGQQPNYPAITYGDTVAALVTLTGGAPDYYPTCEIISIPFLGITFDLISADQIWQTVRANSLGCRTVNPMVAWTYSSSAAAPYPIDYGKANIVANHAYSILGWDYRNGNEYILLRNPWGWYEATLNVETGGDWDAYDISYWRQTPLSTRGVFGLRSDTFKPYFQGFGRITWPSGADVA